MVDVNEITSSAVSVQEAAENEKLWRILGYGNPSTGKTHFLYTMPEPVCIIDTEGKADEIAHKFQDKEVFIWPVNNYVEASRALDESMKVLRKFYQEEDKVGTLGVDLMSDIWDWAQQRHAEMAYPGKEPHEVDFGSALQGEDDWQMIKRLHNEEFRQVMTKSRFHLFWGAASHEDYGAVLSGEADEPPKKPRGESDNEHKVSEMLHFFAAKNGTPHANLKKSGLTRHRFGMLRYPTFDKVKEVVTDIDHAEQTDESIPVSKITDHDVDIIEGDPDIFYRQTQEEDDE